VISGAAKVGWDPVQAMREMRAFIDAQGAFGIARIGFAFLAVTYLWWRLFRSVFDALRTLHRLSEPRAVVGFALGLAALAAFVFLVIAPYFGTVYERFVR
jgi:hypothetical protein